MSIIKNDFSFEETTNSIIEQAGRNPKLLECPYNKLENIEFLLNLNKEGDKKFLNRALIHIGSKCSNDENELFYVLKCIHLFKNCRFLIDDLFPRTLATLAINMPFEIDDPKYTKERYLKYISALCDNRLLIASEELNHCTSERFLAAYMGHFIKHEKRAMKNMNAFTENEIIKANKRIYSYIKDTTVPINIDELIGVNKDECKRIRL